MLVGHCGWGETLFVKNVFPEVPMLANFGVLLSSGRGGCGIRLRVSLRQRPDDESRLQVRNSLNRLSFASCDWGHTATAWRRSLFPASMQREISLVHEEASTRSRVRPDLECMAEVSSRRHRVEPRATKSSPTWPATWSHTAGFHVFMRALPEILQRRPYAHVLIVGGDGVSYGEPPSRLAARTAGMMLDELGDRPRRTAGSIFWDTFRMMSYLNVLQVSSVHVYFSYPFVLSWSFIEAMAAGCSILASATAPVLGSGCATGRTAWRLTSFSPSQMCERIDEVFEHPDRMQATSATLPALTAVDGFRSPYAYHAALARHGDDVGGWPAAPRSSHSPWAWRPSADCVRCPLASRGLCWESPAGGRRFRSSGRAPTSSARNPR